MFCTCIIYILLAYIVNVHYVLDLFFSRAEFIRKAIGVKRSPEGW